MSIAVALTIAPLCAAPSLLAIAKGRRWQGIVGGCAPLVGLLAVGFDRLDRTGDTATGEIGAALIALVAVSVIAAWTVSVAAALGPAIPGSWWDRRTAERAGTPV